MEVADKIYKSEIDLMKFPQNLAVMLNQNGENFSSSAVYQEPRNGEYKVLTWSQFVRDISAIQEYLRSMGLKQGDRIAILSRNCQEMLELELAVMAMGAISVPIFAGYPDDQANRLLDFCNPTFAAVADNIQYAKIKTPESLRKIIHFSGDEGKFGSNSISFGDMVSHYIGVTDVTGLDIPADTVSLMMYTSGTMGRPKCVQLTHGNILSQQAAMKALWDLNQEDRFLSYLPWHHSFGGIFEKFAAIVNGATLSLENGYGKDISTLLKNWNHVRPTVFFSVPRIYQEIAIRATQDPAIEKTIFHDELRFVFTAAAALPKNIADLFANYGVPVIEGWGLTETSPCCTTTDPNIERETGVVGKPIPGVSVRIASDGEILVKGPNVMAGYYSNSEATTEVIEESGWFHTGDIGEYTDTGLKLISRKGRIFKLINGENVVPTEVENLISKDCAYLSHTFLSGRNRDYPVILLFPNKNVFSQKPDKSMLCDRCQCPSNMLEYLKCLSECLKIWNQAITPKYARYKKALVLDYELTIENEELTPSMKLSPKVVENIFQDDIASLYESEKPISKKAYVINLE
ncbi:MAG: AMP-binding protein [Candidatus Poseidoniia archaeon]|nr:AMP-binding protein [Candidatus Poseidoniia archaeon]